MSVLEKFKLVELITTRTDAVATFVSGNQIKFNSATHVDLGYPAYIQMFVDDKGKQFAIKACKEDAPNALKFSKPVGEQKYPIKVSVGAQGSGIESLFRKVLAYYGASYDDIAAWGGKVEYLNIGDASTLFTDGQLNAVSVLAGMPYSTISEIAASKDIKLLTLEQEAVDALSSQGYLAKTIPAGTYTGQDSDVSTVGVVITVCASADANEAVVYEITKFLNSEEGISILGNVNSGFANYMTGPESGIAGIELELHPGAARYYKEAGVA